MKLLNVPVIDISPFRKGTAQDKQEVVARLVDQACRDIGFPVISGHGVAPDLIERTRAVSRAFFDLPAQRKLKVARPAVDVTRGYTGVNEESLARSRDPEAYGSDLNESLMIGPVDPPDPAYANAPAAGKHFAPNIWPEDLPELQAVYTAYYREMGKLAEELMRIFALALGLPEHYFDDKVDRHISRLRVRNYPAQKEAPQPGQIRAGAHSDYGSLTILYAEDKPGGLQVCNANGDWVDVPIRPGCYIVNIGDLMARWSNDNWVSTLHRVVNPPAGAGAESRRQSLVFFHNPNYDAEIANLMPSQAAKYAPTTSGEHLRSLYVKTQNA
ncbi:isopenicillin N synthase family oxygenase [Ramlibacter terrae]|uniref:2-oxoglutarate-dependent ethylene/succinate-forming enzyme n=1 Tax=Ramlibacter terrae TaxID=2732511 RepID=A0ABX6NZY6_9BURK|nr:isopenicillin N synthase family oxygenase [Ramlibacter terrae]